MEKMNNLGLKTFYPEKYSKTKKEFSLEKLIGGKQRIQSHLKQRNGLRCKTPGEKPYKNPEYSLNYFKEGELVPGSSNVENYRKTTSKKNFLFYETLDLTKKTLDPEKLWVNKEKNDILESDKNYVKYLNIWDKTIGSEIPSPVIVNNHINANASNKKKEVKNKL
jgi:hypothetical protein